MCPAFVWRLGDRAGDGLRCCAASGTNNSKLVDDNTAQQLKHEEIEQMKLDGRGGRAIVDAVVKNSSTYAEKTEYAKEKYIRKKQKKCVSLRRVDANCARASARPGACIYR
jgi:hypothetical protein